MRGANGTEWMDYDLPQPTLLHHANRGIFIGWALDGWFGTERGRDYLNDIIARYLITFKDEEAERLPYKPLIDTIKNETHINLHSHKLKTFQGLKSIVRAKKLAATRSETHHDHVFWAIKFYCEELIETQGTPTYDQMIRFATTNFLYKEKSTLRAKVRSVYNWYSERCFTIPKSRKSKMSRIENIKRVHTERAEGSKMQIRAILENEKNADEFKKKNGKWNASKIARHLKIDARTVRKYL